MAAAARKIEVEFPMQEPTVLEKKVDRAQEDIAVLKADVKVLRSDVNHLQEAVADLKTDVKRIDAKVDAVGASLTEHRLETEKSIGNLRVEMKDRIAELRNETKDAFSELRNEMKDGFAALRAEIAASRIEMKESFEKFRDRRFTQIAWIIGTVIASIGTSTGTAVAVLKYFTGA